MFQGAMHLNKRSFNKLAEYDKSITGVKEYLFETKSKLRSQSEELVKRK